MMIKFPLNIILNYVAEGDLPINTVTSTHFIEDLDDVDVVASFINVFCCETFTQVDVIDLISIATNNAGTAKSIADDNLTIRIF